MRRKNIKTVTVGRNKREFLLRLPAKRYDALSKIAFKNDVSINYEVNQAIERVLVEAGLAKS